MKLRPVIGALLVLMMPAAPSAVATTPALPADTRFYHAPPNPGAVQQAKALKQAGRTAAAARITAMAAVPQAVWFTEGTPSEVGAYATEIIDAAKDDGSVPVVVAYNVPGRDCGSYSGGGAATGTAYRNWIDAIVDALGQTKAVVIVEPDGLALLPSDCGLADPYNRVSLLSYAAHAFLADANALVYMDAGNSNWNTVGLMAQRLVAIGVDEIAGFALNVSNFQYTDNSTQYGTWVSKCIAYGTYVSPGNFDECPDQYGSVDGIQLSSFGHWSDTAAKAKFNTSAENAHYSSLLGATQPTTHFVIDTSRNARGPWSGTNAHPQSHDDTEAWCNPPGRGGGARPSASTGKTLVDAYLWIKLPGESDGKCYRWTDGPNDPVFGIEDPDAGAWFRKTALQMANNAIPVFP
ncbi:MAG TPA: glycoside hydrolase family 6 protein [Candidatus Limnocylindria bacterium]|nr:glycoside hydrolase family 6 protein [Candidatus Limnocylindria bacterium]